MDTMKLKSLLAQRGITQTELARLLGRDKSVITNLLQGRRQLKADEAGVIARMLGVSVAEILGLEEISGHVSEAPLIPFQHEPVQARRARQVVRREGQYFLEESGFTSKAYALEVRDESMNLAGLLPGDIIISELDAQYKPGQIVVAQHYQGAGAVTVLRRYEPPFLLARSTRDNFPPLSLENGEARVVSPVLKMVRLF